MKVSGKQAAEIYAARKRLTDCTCSLCGGQFGMETEGGVEGYIGILPVQFCPTCWAGIDDFVSQRCQWCMERELEET